VLAIVLTSLLAFASTNVDDLLVLLLLFGQGRDARAVVLGQYLGFAALVLASLVLSCGALLLRPEWVGFLGAAPLLIGAKALIRLRGRSERPSERAPTAMGVWPIAAVTVANGGDNIAVYGALFARRSPTELAAVLAVLGAMVAVWCVTANWLRQLPGVASALARWGHWIAPVVLVSLGVYIFIAQGTATYVLDSLRHGASRSVGQ
jgi:cadmium resistance protein CadD (predicted permease)